MRGSSRDAFMKETMLSNAVTYLGTLGKVSSEQVRGMREGTSTMLPTKRTKPKVLQLPAPTNTGKGFHPTRSTSHLHKVLHHHSSYVHVSTTVCQRPTLAANAAAPVEPSEVAHSLPLHVTHKLIQLFVDGRYGRSCPSHGFHAPSTPL